MCFLNQPENVENEFLNVKCNALGEELLYQH